MSASIFAWPVTALAWLGRQGTRAIAALVVIGIAIPPLGEALKPYVTEAVFVLLCISFVRVDIAALRGYLRRPGVVIAATLWTTILVPLLMGLVCLATGFDRYAPDIFLGVMLQGAASPMMASPALALLMGLDATLVLITLVTSTALVPFTAPLFAYILFGGMLTLSPLALGIKLIAILGGSLAVSLLIRRFVSEAAITRHKAAIDGFNIIILLFFVSAVMGTLAPGFFAHPGLVLAVTVLAFVVFALLLGVTVAVFARAGMDRALALGLMVSQRNMGLMVAATDGVLPGLTWIYFALGQLPIYLSPQLLKPVAQRLRAGKDDFAPPSMSVSHSQSAVSPAKKPSR
ncbi:bile acid:sodium symporter family protein [Afipia sp. TerB]